MTKLIRIPWAFYIDHSERDLETPEIVKSTKRHIWIRADDPALSELRSDAAYYCHKYGPDAEYLFGLKASARATMNAINAALGEEA